VCHGCPGGGCNEAARPVRGIVNSEAGTIPLIVVKLALQGRKLLLAGMDASMTHASLSMVRRAAAAAAMLVLAAGFSGCNKLKARDLLNKGVAAFKNGQYDEAVDKFQQATEADPDLINARLYLATAYATQYIPGAPSDQNKKVGEQAVTVFKSVLDRDSKNLNAIDGIGSILFQMAGTPYKPAMFEESKKYHQMHI